MMQLDAIKAARELAAAVPRESFELVRAFAVLFGIVGAVFALASGALAYAVAAAAPVWIIAPLALGLGTASIIAVVVLWALRNGQQVLSDMLNVALDAISPELPPTTATRVAFMGKVQSFNEIETTDWDYFINELAVRGHAKNKWLGTTLPSGKVVATFEDYNRFIIPLEQHGILTGRSERVSGTLTTTDPALIKSKLGLV